MTGTGENSRATPTRRLRRTPTGAHPPRGRPRSVSDPPGPRREPVRDRRARRRTRSPSQTRHRDHAPPSHRARLAMTRSVQRGRSRCASRIPYCTRRGRSGDQVQPERRSNGGQPEGPGKVQRGRSLRQAPFCPVRGVAERFAGTKEAERSGYGRKSDRTGVQRLTWCVATAYRRGARRREPRAGRRRRI